MTWPFVPARHFTRGGLREVRAILWHMAEGGGTVGYLRTARINVSATFVIEYTGRTVRMVADGDASHSAHVSIDEDNADADDCGGLYDPSIARAILGPDGWRDVNAYVVSVEIEGFRRDGPNPSQRAAIVALYGELRERYPTIRGNLGHRDVQDYKGCPGCRFPWEAIGGHGRLSEDDMGLRVEITDPSVRGVLRMPDAGVAAIELHSGLPVTVRGVRRVHATARRTDPDGAGYIIGNAGQAPLFVGLSVAPMLDPDPGGAGDDLALRDEAWRTWIEQAARVGPPR